MTIKNNFFYILKLRNFSLKNFIYFNIRKDLDDTGIHYEYMYYFCMNRGNGSEID